MAASIIPQLNMQHFHEMEALELQFYDAEFIAPAEETWRWYEQHPHSTIAAEADGRLVGFVNLFPVKPEVYRAILSGEFNDHFMEVSDLAPLDASPLHMFLSCVVVHRDYRHQGIIRLLLRAAVQSYAGKPCAGIVTDNVTEDGCRFSERFGFRFLRESDHQSRIYEQSWQEFVSQVQADSVDKRQETL